MNSDDAHKALETDQELRAGLLAEAMNGYPIAIWYSDGTVSTNTFGQAEAILAGACPIEKDGATPIAAHFSRLPAMTTEERQRGERLLDRLHFVFGQAKTSTAN